MKTLKIGYEATPKVLSWFGIPSHFSEFERFELLKRDIYVHEAAFEQLPGLWAINSRFTGYIFNLDRILEHLPFPRLAGVMVLAKKLINYLNHFCPHNCAVHTRILNEDLKQVFEAAGIPLYQQNLEYRPTAWQVIKQRFLPIVEIENAAFRRFVRVNFNTNHNFHVSIFTEKSIRPIAGVMHNLSLNGVGISLNESRSLRYLDLRDAVKVSIRNAQTSFQLATAFVTRRDEATRELGLNFNIVDESFVSRNDAVNLSRTVYHGLNEKTTKTIKTGLERGLEII